MARIRYGEALGEFGFPSSFFRGELHYNGYIRDSNHHIIGARYVDSDPESGGEIDLVGKRMKFGAGHVPVAGIVTHFSVLDHNHDVLVSLTNTIVNPKAGGSRPYNVHLLWNAYSTGTTDTEKFEKLMNWALGGNDKTSGSSHGDYILGGRGHDIIHGNDGGDWITGDAAADTLYGDGGADTFWFGRGQGHDTVKDYEAGVDEIGLLSTDQLFHYDTDKGVYLQFAAADDPAHPTAANPADWMLIEGKHFSDLSFYNMQ